MSNLQQSAAGEAKEVQKAYIVLYDQTVVKVSIKNNDETQTYNLDTQSVQLSQNTMKSAAEAALNGNTPKAAEAVQKNSGKTAQKKKIFQVQFNPNKLTISAQAKQKETQQDKTNKEKKQDSLEQIMAGTGISVSIQLIFAGQKDKHSVREQVEGFLSAVRSPRTSKIAFHWNQMCYEGYLTSVAAEYKMFDAAGKPVYAELNLSLECSNADQEENPQNYWKEIFQKAFAVK